MPSVCESCGWQNRTRAMFCSGCLKKLPAFVASGPSALETLPGKLAASTVGANSMRVLESAAGTTSFPLWLPVLLIALCIVFVGWFATMPRNGKATLQVASAGSSGTSIASAPAFYSSSVHPIESGADRDPMQPGKDALARWPPLARAMVEQGFTDSDSSALNTVAGFYHALSVGDGRGAAAAVTPAKRGVTAFREDQLASFYGSLREPLVVEAIWPIAVNRFEARYSYRATRARCSARAIVETEVINQQTYIRSIRAPC